MVIVLFLTLSSSGLVPPASVLLRNQLATQPYFPVFHSILAQLFTSSYIWKFSPFETEPIILLFKFPFSWTYKVVAVTVPSTPTRLAEAPDVDASWLSFCSTRTYWLLTHAVFPENLISVQSPFCERTVTSSPLWSFPRILPWNEGVFRTFNESTEIFPIFVSGVSGFSFSVGFVFEI